MKNFTRQLIVVNILSFLVIIKVNAQNTFPWPSTGNIGIGVSPPSNTLTVNGTEDITVGLGIGTNSPSAQLHIYQSSSPLMLFTSSTASNGFYGGLAGSKTYEAGPFLTQDPLPIN